MTVGLDTIVMLAFGVTVILAAARLAGIAEYNLAWVAVPYLTALTVQITIQLIALIERESNKKKIRRHKNADQEAADWGMPH